MNSIGFMQSRENPVLKSFGRFTREINYSGPLKWEIVKKYCERDGNNSSLGTKVRRFEVIAPFGKYVSNMYPETELLPIQPYGKRAKRPRPHIYSDLEILELFKRCENIYSPDGIRKLTLSTAIGLMLTTGIRTSEMINLHVSDLDVDRKVLIVRNGKNGKARILPLLDSVVMKLVNYKNAIQTIMKRKLSEEDFLLRNTGGEPMTERAIEYAFSKIRDCVDMSDSDYTVPILYHLRHTFACRTIANWVKSGVDVNSRLYILSVYLGHEHPEDTYWYLSATDSILKNASVKYEYNFGGDSDV